MTKSEIFLITEMPTSIVTIQVAQQGYCNQLTVILSLMHNSSFIARACYLQLLELSELQAVLLILKKKKKKW